VDLRPREAATLAAEWRGVISWTEVTLWVASVPPGLFWLAVLAGSFHGLVAIGRSTASARPSLCSPSGRRAVRSRRIAATAAQGCRGLVLVDLKFEATPSAPLYHSVRRPSPYR
jgi:hypothetical protein